MVPFSYILRVLTFRIEETVVGTEAVGKAEIKAEDSSGKPGLSSLVNEAVD